MSYQLDPITETREAEFLDRPDGQLEDRALPLIRDGLLFNEDAYRLLREHDHPARRGALILLVIVAIVAIAQAIGLALGLLTSPRIDILQDSIYDFITQMRLYSRRAANVPEFALRFSQIYEGVWQAVRLAGGYPSWSGTLVAASTAVVGAFLNWLVFGLLAHWTARWFRGQARYTQFLGPLALSYSPLLLTVVLLVPGASIAMPLVFLALLVSKFLAVKTTYGLSTFGSLAATLIPYVIVTLLLAALAIFGTAYFVGRIPFIDEILRGLSLIRMF